MQRSIASVPCQWPGRPIQGWVRPADAGVAGSLVVVLVLSVGVAGGLADAAAGCSPGHLAWFGLGEVPAFGLLAPVVVPAERREVALTGPAPQVGTLHHFLGPGGPRPQHRRDARTSTSASYSGG